MKKSRANKIIEIIKHPGRPDYVRVHRNDKPDRSEESRQVAEQARQLRAEQRVQPKFLRISPKTPRLK